MGKLVKLSLKDRLVGELSRKILNGELGPGQRLVEHDLVSEYGVSRSVVRESLVVLELQGLIISTPYTGTEVASISRAEIEGLLLPIRVHVEQFALRQGLPRFDSSSFDAFDAVLNDMERAVYDRNIEAFNTVDVRFHELIVDSSDSLTARSVWDSIHQRIRMHFALQTGRTGALVSFLDDHRRLVEVFRAGDLDNSLSALKTHILDTNSPHLDLLDTASGDAFANGGSK